MDREVPIPAPKVAVEDTLTAAVAAWEGRRREPRRALELARGVLRAQPHDAVKGLAMAAIAVASITVAEADEALAAAQQVPELLTEEAVSELGELTSPADGVDLADLLVEAKLAQLRGYFLRGDLVSAVRSGREALEIAGRHAVPQLEAQAHSELAAAFGSRNLLDVALRHLRTGIAILESAGLPVPPTLLNNLGNVYHDAGRLEEALACYTRSREAFVVQGDRFRASLARSNEGRALLALGRIEEAGEAFEESLTWHEGLDNRTYYAATLAKAADGHAAAGDHRRAEQRFEQALQALRGDDDPFEDEVRERYGRYLLRVGRPHEALAQFDVAMRRLQAMDSMVLAVDLLDARARALAELGRFEEAYDDLRGHFDGRLSREGRGTEQLVHAQLAELEAGLDQQHELNVVAHQAMIDANRELRERTRELEGLSTTDDLTGLYNRRYFRLRLNEEGRRAARQGHDLVLMLIDVDHFKQVNDLHSHTVGDKVLVEVGALLKGRFRGSDVLARWGGEEFAVLLPASKLGPARDVAERARQVVAAHDWDRFAPGLNLTVSIGMGSVNEVAEGDEGAGGSDRVKALVELVDARLYQAKRAGRNRTVW